MKAVKEIDELYALIEQAKTVWEKNALFSRLLLKCKIQDISVLDYVRAKSERISEPLSEKKSETSEISDFRCETCKRKFKSQNALNAHSKSHK